MHRAVTTTPLHRRTGSVPAAVPGTGGSRSHRYSHPPHALVHAGLIHQHHDLGVGEVCVLLRLGELLDLDVGQLHLLLRVYHLRLQLRESLGRGKEQRPSGATLTGRGPPTPHN